MISSCHPRRRPRLLATVAISLVAVAGVPAAPASAASLGVSCPDATAQPFQPWGDFSFYAFVPNGGFESGPAGWTLAGGAGVRSGNEPFHVDGAGSQSLALPAGSSATTPSMCIGLLSTKMRFFAVNTGSPSAVLKVQVVYAGGLGQILGTAGSTLGVSDVGYITNSGAWTPTPEISMLGGTLPLLTQSVQFRFVPVGTAGNWRIDDVNLDPLMHR
ncbi:MAG: hypothetical protein ACTHNU_16265 [Gaiellales bacterium]